MRDSHIGVAETHPRSARARKACRRWLRIAGATSTLLTATASALVAQEAPTIRGVLAGYVAVGYSTTLGDGHPNDFSALLAPVPIFNISDDLFVEGEVELALHDTGTLVTLEHVQVHYLGFDRVQFAVGRFHLPIGIWNHTNWVNKMPQPPLLYEDTHGDATDTALMPIPFDLGAVATWTLPTRGWRTSATVWLSQGPRPGEPHEAEAGAPPPDLPVELLSYGANYEDNNTDKMLGLRVRTVSGADAGLTFEASGFRAAYDDAGDLEIRGLNVGMVWSPGGVDAGGLFDFRAEGTLLNQQYVDSTTSSVEDMTSKGYYLQLSRRFGEVEPVVRWSHLPGSSAAGTQIVERRRQLGIGLNYWLAPSVPLKAAYYWEADRTDQLYIEWAVGF